ncbi:hypothetical protein PMAYCL1PPCAC_01834, partial [Pristionchus mayeri]
QTVRVVVRRGCMFTGYAHEISGTAWQERTCSTEFTKCPTTALLIPFERFLVGSRPVKIFQLSFPAYLDGLTRASCVCDPTEATVNGHVPSPPHQCECKYKYLYLSKKYC